MDRRNSELVLYSYQAAWLSPQTERLVRGDLIVTPRAIYFSCERGVASWALRNVSGISFAGCLAPVAGRLLFVRNAVAQFDIFVVQRAQELRDALPWRFFAHQKNQENRHAA